jgi:hypothetical protein
VTTVIVLHDKPPDLQTPQKSQRQMQKITGLKTANGQ